MIYFSFTTRPASKENGTFGAPIGEITGQYVLDLHIYQVRVT